MDSLKSFVSNYCSGFEPGLLFAVQHPGSFGWFDTPCQIILIRGHFTIKHFSLDTPAQCMRAHCVVDIHSYKL